ncbi:MAG TPA: serine--tRNA ligase [Acidimicrobiales bacterium]|nr:serine--tRNA ligase [Acidimicrobiales bacterium]
MLDVQDLRTQERVDELVRRLNRRGGDFRAEIEELAALDSAARALQQESEDLRRRAKEISTEVGAARRAGDVARAEELQVQGRAESDRQKEVEVEAKALRERVRVALLGIPNVPADDAPDGAGEEDNVVVRVEGTMDWAEHQRVPHWEIGEQLAMLDPQRAVRMTSTMFNMYRGEGARLTRALTALALERHADAWEEIRPPSVVSTATLTATGHLPKFEDEAYHVERDDLWLIPTAEVPLTSMHAGELMQEADLPVRYAAYTPCFRREAGAAGRDTRGLLRSHEFDKVELMAFCTPEQAEEIHAEILRRSEGLLQELGLTYRVLDLCTGDLGFSNRRTFDLEAFAPGTDQWLEVSSVSWYGDFQARRADTRFKRADGSGTAIPHTLNGSSLAWPRVWAALVETHRRPNGTISVPLALQPYLGTDVLGKGRLDG